MHLHRFLPFFAVHELDLYLTVKQHSCSALQPCRRFWKTHEQYCFGCFSHHISLGGTVPAPKACNVWVSMNYNLESIELKGLSYIQRKFPTPAYMKCIVLVLPCRASVFFRHVCRISVVCSWAQRGRTLPMII